MKLDPFERFRIAAELWESAGSRIPASYGDDLDELLRQRDAEIEANPSLEIAHEQFMERFEARRRK